MNRERIIDKSGSCALVCIYTSQSKAYIAHVGDSRAIMSEQNGKMVTQLTKDHKPAEKAEF